MSSMTTRVSRQALLAVAWLCFLILGIVSGALADETRGSELTRNSASRRLHQDRGEPYTACVAGQVPSWAATELPEGEGSWRDLQELVETIGKEGGEAEEWRVFDLQGRTLSAAHLGGGNGAGGPDADLVFFSVVPSRHGMYELPAGRTILRNGTLVLPLDTGLRFEGPGQIILDKVEVRWPSTAASLPLGGEGGPPLEGSEWPHRGSAALEFRGPGLQVWLNSVAVRAVHEEEAQPPAGAIANGGARSADGNGISGSFLLVGGGQEDEADAVVNVGTDDLPPPLHAAVVASSGTALSLTCGAISNRGGAHSLAARDAGTVVRASYASFRDSVASGVAVLDGAAAVLEQCAVLSVGGAAEGAVSAGVVLTGNGSAHMEGSSVEACDTGVSVGPGSRLQMNRCAVLDSRRDAAAVAGGGALFFAKSSVFRDGGRYGVAAQDAAGVRMQRCLLSSNERDGVWAAGADTLVVGSGLRSSRNAANGLRAEAGASVTLSGSHVDLNAGNGAHAVQPGSVLQASDTSFRSNGGTGVMARGRGRASLRDCSMHENNGSGLLAAGPGSAASAGASSFLGNAEWGAAARHGGEVKLTDCSAERNGFAGLAAHNSTSQLSAADTTAANNPVGGVDVAFGGSVSAKFCNFSANGRVGASVVGLESQLDLDGSEALGNGWYGLYAAEAAQLGFSSGTLSGNGRGGGRVEGFATRAVLQSAGVLGNDGPGFVLEASARLSLLDSIVTDNSGPGLLGSGPQTALDAEASRVAANKQHGLFLTDHATANLGGACNLSSNGWSGAWLEESSSLFAEASFFNGNQDAGIGAASGATVIVTSPQESGSEMASCSLSHNRRASGMDASGRGTRVSVLRCMLQGNGEMGAVVAGRAQGSVSGCQVVDNDSFGVLVRDPGSFATVLGTTIAGNELGSAVGLYGGRVATDTVTASRCDPAC